MSGELITGFIIGVIAEYLVFVFVLGAEIRRGSKGP